MKQMIKRIGIIGAVLFMLSGCVQGNQEKAKIEVKVQVWAMKYLVESIGKEEVNVSLAVASGDAHHKEPTQKEIAELTKSHLFFYTDAGDLGREAHELIKASGTSDGKNVDVMKGLESIVNGSEKDPHVWLSPKQMIVMAKTVKESLCEKRSDKKEVFESHYKDVVAQLQQLDQTMTELFAHKTKSEILVEHAAYGYLARDYGFAQHALTESHNHASGEHHSEDESGAKVSEHTEMSAAQIETLKQIVQEEKFTTLFADSQNQSELTEKIAKELNITLQKVSTLETLSQNEQADYVVQMKQIAEKFAKEMA